MQKINTLPFTIGIELEFLIYKNKQLWPARKEDISCDGNNLQGEIRTNPHLNVFNAISDLKNEFCKLTWIHNDLTFVIKDWIPKNKEYDSVIEKIAREYGAMKNISWQNLYGFPPSKLNKNYLSSGLHISLKSENAWTNTCKCGRIHKNNATGKMIDFPFYFRKIEKEFLPEIKASKRTIGFYEVKSDGRVEYRSLPATLFLNPNFAERLNKCFCK